jgi:hypothetical protein
MTAFNASETHQTVPDIYQYAERLVQDGYGNDQIVHRLMVQGIAEVVAQELITNIRHTMSENERRKAKNRLASGIVACVLGLMCLMVVQHGFVLGIIPALGLLMYGILRVTVGASYYLKQSHRSQE